MQSAPSNYNTIIAGPHRFETRVIFTLGNGSTLTMMEEDGIFSISRKLPGMPENYPSVGGALSSTLYLKVKTPAETIPKMGQIVVQFRAVDDTDSSNVSGWAAAGTYFIDTRAESEDAVSTTEFTAYDAMMKGEQDYIPDSSESWPRLDSSVVSDIATAIGVAVDSRTNSFLTAGYRINPPTDYVMREVLENIAAMYGGNFVITAENKLLFVPLYGIDPEENMDGYYLAEDGSTDALMFGDEGWYIIV